MVQVVCGIAVGFLHDRQDQVSRSNVAPAGENHVAHAAVNDLVEGLGDALLLGSHRLRIGCFEEVPEFAGEIVDVDLEQAELFAEIVVFHADHSQMVDRDIFVVAGQCKHSSGLDEFVGALRVEFLAVIRHFTSFLVP
ncbi:hypothetical protein D3C71_1381430 [compost metagenome]